jgi:hypothetical protein
LQSATSSAATKFAALECLPRDEESLLDFLEGVLSLVMPGEEPGDEPLLFWDSSFTVPMNLMTPDKPNTVVSIDPLPLFHLATASFTTRFLLSQLYKHST